MTHRLIWTNPATGSVSIAHTVAVKSTPAALTEYAKTVVPDGTEFTILPIDAYPADTTYRDAWTFGGGKFGVDIKRARVVQRGIIRQARKALMVELDYKQNSGEDVTQERQRLKDFPDLVESVTDIETLKALIPVASA